MGMIEPLRIILDGEEFNANPLKSFESGNWNLGKQVIMGTTVDEVYIPTYVPIPIRERFYQVIFALVCVN